MKKKHENGFKILIMTFTNLEKYLYSKKVLKNFSVPVFARLRREHA